MHVVKCLSSGWTDPGGRLRNGDGSTLPQRVLGRGKKLAAPPAAASSDWLSVFCLCAVPLRATLPMKTRKSSRTLRSCRVTPSLCCVPCVSCPGVGIDTRRAPGQTSSSGCLRASPFITSFRSSFWWGSWADPLAVSSMDNVIPCECSAFRFRVAAGLWLACAAPFKSVVHANSSVPACQFPFPGPAWAFQVCLCSPVGFQTLSSILVCPKAIYLFCGIYSKTRLGVPREGIRVALTVWEEMYKCWEFLFLTNNFIFCLLW